VGWSTGADWLRGAGVVGLGVDRIFCVAPMPWYRHSCGNGLGFAAGQRQAGCNKRLPFAARTVGIKGFMAAGSPAVAVLARPVQGATLLTEWVAPLAKGHMAVVSSAVMAGPASHSK